MGWCSEEHQMTSWRQRLREKDRIIEAQQKEIDELKEEIRKIKQYLKAFDNAHTPSSKQLKKNIRESDSKDKESEEKKKPRFPGKPKCSNGGGIKLPKPDDVIEHKLDVCPISGKPLGEPVGYRVKTIIDFPDKPIQTIEHRIMQYISPETGEIVEAKVDLSRDIYGKNIKSIAIMLKNLTNSHDKISDFLRELGAPSFSSKTVQNIATSYIFALEPIQKNIIHELKKESYLHSDETGFREDGKNGYVWGIFTKTQAIFLAVKSRAAKHFIKLIRNFKGVIVVDGYGGYDFYPLKQRCWAHLIREFKELAKENPEIDVQFRRLLILYEKLKEMNTGPPIEKEIDDAKWILADILTCLKPIKGAKKIWTYIKNGGNDWFTALYYEGVPLHNNHAERELRSVVLLRKAIGCYRNWKGKRWIDVVISTIHTWKLQGQNIFQNLRVIQI